MCQKRTDSQKPLSGACAKVQGQATAQLQLSNQSPAMCQLGISAMRSSIRRSPTLALTAMIPLIRCGKHWCCLWRQETVWRLNRPASGAGNVASCARPGASREALMAWQLSGQLIEQCRELETIFSGKKGGPGAVLSSLVSKWLPTESAAIKISRGDSPEIDVGNIGHVKLEPIKDQGGKTATVVNAPVLGLIEITQAELARSDGSRFADPQMREWASGGHGSINPFSWEV